jgi:hypothetical protein
VSITPSFTFCHRDSSPWYVSTEPRSFGSNHSGNSHKLVRQNDGSVSCNFGVKQGNTPAPGTAGSFRPGPHSIRKRSSV